MCYINNGREEEEEEGNFSTNRERGAKHSRDPSDLFKPAAVQVTPVSRRMELDGPKRGAANLSDSHISLLVSRTALAWLI